MAGITSTGFVTKTFNEIVSSLEAQAQSKFGSDVDLEETSPLKQFINTVAIELEMLWDLVEDTYYAGFADYATGIQLDRIGALLGVPRQAAAFATGTETFNGVDSTNIPQGTKVMTNTGIVFQTTASGTITGGTVDIAIEALIAGTDGNVSSATIVVLVDSISGVTSVTNASAMTGGTDVETDAAYRIRIKARVETLGKATLTALEQAVLAVSGVTKVSGVENVTTHAVTIYEFGLTLPDTDVTAAVEDTRAAGISVSAVEATDVDLYIDVDVTLASDAPADAVAQIVAAIVAHVNDHDIGEDVIYTKLYDVVFSVGDWVENATSLKLDDVDPPTTTVDYTIAVSEIARTQTSSIGVT